MIKLKVRASEIDRLQNEVYQYLLNPTPENNMFITRRENASMSMKLTYVVGDKALFSEITYTDLEDSYSLKFYSKFNVRTPFIDASSDHLKRISGAIVKSELGSFPDIIYSYILERKSSEAGAYRPFPVWICTNRNKRHFFHLFLAKDNVAGTNMEVSEGFLKLMKLRITKARERRENQSKQSLYI